MHLYAIGDLHYSGNPPTKPMNIFGDHWTDHESKINHSWNEQVNNNDIVCIVGDISWAMKLENALPDLLRISQMPGKKIMIRGNHDFWWSSKKKMTTSTNETITFLQGDAVNTPTASIGGTRGWLCEGDSYFDKKKDQPIYEKELVRMERSLQSMDTSGKVPRIMLLHYPPFNDRNEPSGFTNLLEKYHIDHCIFGHLHDTPSFARVPSHWGHTKLHLVSADYLHFSVKQIV